MYVLDLVRYIYWYYQYKMSCYFPFPLMAALSPPTTQIEQDPPALPKDYPAPRSPIQMTSSTMELVKVDVQSSAQPRALVMGEIHTLWLPGGLWILLALSERHGEFTETSL